LSDIIDLYERRNGKFELNNKQSAIISLGHFGGQFAWADATYAQRAQIYRTIWTTPWACSGSWPPTRPSRRTSKPR